MCTENNFWTETQDTAAGAACGEQHEGSDLAPHLSRPPAGGWLGCGGQSRECSHALRPASPLQLDSGLAALTQAGMKARAFSPSGSQVTATSSGKPSLTYTPRHRRPQHPQVHTLRVVSDVTPLLSTPHVCLPALPGPDPHGPTTHSITQERNEQRGNEACRKKGALSAAPTPGKQAVIEIDFVCIHPGARACQHEHPYHIQMPPPQSASIHRQGACTPSPPWALL